ncbi:MAG: hypothetical protein IT435_05710 [Phycisphaerales bacterium]|nr:hypothetical protein [Phycisphaerales bacterium]
MNAAGGFRQLPHFLAVETEQHRQLGGECDLLQPAVFVDVLCPPHKRDLFLEEDVLPAPQRRLAGTHAGQELGDPPDVAGALAPAIGLGPGPGGLDHPASLVVGRRPGSLVAVVDRVLGVLEHAGSAVAAGDVLGKRPHQREVAVVGAALLPRSRRSLAVQPARHRGVGDIAWLGPAVLLDGAAHDLAVGTDRLLRFAA